MELLNRRFDSPQQRGRVFERLLRAAFGCHPGEYGPQRFRRVWLWSQWPDRERFGYGGDVGIDLVAEQTEAWGGGLCAVQAKLHSPGQLIGKAAVDSFLSASAGECFSERLLVVTAELGANADLMVKKATPRCQILDAAQLDEWPVDWAAFLDKPEELRFAAVRHEPKPYQAEAVDAVVSGLADRDRGKLILPCGTGKSVVALWIAEQMAGAGGRVLYLVPSIALMGQTMREWAAQRDPQIPHRYIGVCSDTRAGRNDEDADIAELAMPVTTDPERVAAALAGAGPGAMTVVFCTYQSLEVIEQAQQAAAGDAGPDTGGPDRRQGSHGQPTVAGDGRGPAPAGFDLALCDEAHRTTGVHEAEAGSHFTLIHDPARIAAAKRLYMTATPRVYTDRVRAKASEQSRDFDVFSMDDEAAYGPELYRMSFGSAVEQGHLSDYEVLVIAVSELHVASTLGADVLNLPDEAESPAGGGAWKRSARHDAGCCQVRGMLGRAGRPEHPLPARPHHRRGATQRSERPPGHRVHQHDQALAAR